MQESLSVPQLQEGGRIDHLAVSTSPEAQKVGPEHEVFATLSNG